MREAKESNLAPPMELGVADSYLMLGSTLTALDALLPQVNSKTLQATFRIPEKTRFRSKFLTITRGCCIAEGPLILQKIRKEEPNLPP